MANFLKGKTGIYTMITKDVSKAGYTDHVDFIINGHTINGAHLNVSGHQDHIHISINP